MPLPSPHDGQSEKDFIAACMGSDVIQNDFDTQEQRLAVCYSQYKRAHKQGKANWEDVEASIQKDGMIITDEEAKIIFPNVKFLQPVSADPYAHWTYEKIASVANKEPYGDVEYADPGYQKDKKKRYPINTPEHIRAAWNYINQSKNAAEYSAGQVAVIKARIIRAWKAKIDPKGPPSVAKAAFYRVATKEPVNLPDGEYTSLRYGYVIEIDNKTFPTQSGVRCTKEGAGEPRKTIIKNGLINIEY